MIDILSIEYFTRRIIFDKSDKLHKSTSLIIPLASATKRITFKN